MPRGGDARTTAWRRASAERRGKRGWGGAQAHPSRVRLLAIDGGGPQQRAELAGALPVKGAGEERMLRPIRGASARLLARRGRG